MPSERPRSTFWSVNIGQLLTLLTLAGTLFGVWRATELKAVENAKDLQAFEKRLAATEAVEKAMLERMEKIGDQLGQIAQNQAKVAAILDMHIMNKP